MERTIYECDSCGTRFGAKNDVVPVQVRSKNGEWRDYTDVELHFCFDCHGPAASDLNKSAFARFLVDEGGEIVGVEDGWRNFVALSEFDHSGLDDDKSLHETARAVKGAVN
jgi:hypothetical protein